VISKLLKYKIFINLSENILSLILLKFTRKYIIIIIIIIIIISIIIIKHKLFIFDSSFITAVHKKIHRPT